MSTKPDLIRLQPALEAATLGVWEIDLETRTLTCSAQCKANFGRPGTEPFTYADLFASIHPADRDRVAAAVATASGRGELYECEYRVTWPDGSLHWIAARGTVTSAPGQGHRLAGVTMDVSGNKSAGEAGRAAREFAERLIESSTDCIKVLDLAGRVTWVSPAGLLLLGATEDTVVGRAWPTFWSGCARTLAERAVAKASEGGADRFEAESCTFDGRARWWDVRVTPISGADGAPESLLAVSTDITERKRAEEALRQACEDLEQRVSDRTSELQELAVTLGLVREDERTRLARELHDELGQVLTALKLDLRVVRRAVEGHRRVRGIVASRLCDMEALLDGTLSTVERIVNELRPAVLDELGFCAAADWLVQQFASRCQVATTFTCPEDVEVSGETSTVLFRILQESLTNVARHADARTVTVSLRREMSGFVLSVIDDGRGLPPGSGRPLTSGVRGMQERVRAVGGTLSLAGEAGGGTAVVARVPRPVAS